jgi:hypothetical protein
MSLVTATTVAALLIASPSSTDAARVAADGGFLLGNAHRCGIEGTRIERAAQLIGDLVRAAAPDTKEQDEATTRFARFFIVSAFADPTAEKLVASCKMVVSEFEQLERHHASGNDANAATGDSTGRRFGPGDGE